MSARAAHLLLQVAEYFDMAANAGAFRKPPGGSDVPVGNALAQEVMTWAKGYREHLDHLRHEAEGERKAQAKVYSAEQAMRDEEALERVRALAARRDADNFACVLAQEALDLLEKETRKE